MAEKGQSAIEFFIVIGFLVFVFLAMLSVVESNVRDKLRDQANLEVREVALIVQDEVNLAHSSSDGYQRNFKLPLKVANRDYKINITSGLVFVRTEDEKYSLSLPVLNVTGNARPGDNLIRKNGGEVFLNE